MTQYIGDAIVDRLRDVPMADYRVEEFATVQGHAHELARSERNLRSSDLRRLCEQVGQLALAVSCQGQPFAGVRDEFLLLYPLVAGSGARRGGSGPSYSKGFQKVLFACLDAVERVGEAGDPDAARAANLVALRRFLEAVLQYRIYQGG